MRVVLKTKQTIDVDDAVWRPVWSGNFSAAIGESYSIWTASVLRDRGGRSLIYVVRDEAEGDSQAVGEISRPRPEYISPILRRLCERAGLEEFPETWEAPALEAAERAED